MRTRLRRSIIAVLSSFLLLAPVALAASPAAADPAPAVVINEVESNGDTTDWVELKNTGTVDADLAGFVLKDNAEKDPYTFPSGSVVAPGGYLVVEPVFGLGGGDSARLFAADGTTLVATYSWTAHATTTYGRCADGTGDFVTTFGSSKGATNVCTLDPATVVRINEVESNGDTTDWIELKNTGASSVDVSGLVVKDNAEKDPYAIPTGTTIAAGAYLVIEPVFGLGGGDSARLFAADGTTVIDTYTWTAHATTTYGRCPDGVGSFATTTASTKGAVNNCAAPVVPSVRINEVESNGGTPGDWAELFNPGSAAVDISGWVFKDNDDTHRAALPSGTILAAGGYFVIEEAFFGNGLGSADSARLFLADEVTVVDSRSWTAHATTTYGVCGTEFSTTTSSTKGAANDCTAPIRINEVESNGDTTDWIELKNNGSAAVDLAGYVLKDNSDKDAYTFPTGSTIAGGGYLVVEPVFGLGGGDSARLFAIDGTTVVDTYTWTTHAATTYGRCPDGTGDFTTTSSSTNGAVNACPGDLVTSPWPGGSTIATAERTGDFGGDFSGLAFEGTTVWGVSNGAGILYRLTQSGSNWIPDTSNGWSAGKVLRYADGTGTVDSEGVALTSAGAAGGVYVASERNNASGQNGISKLAVLRYDVTGSATELTATNEWNITEDLPSVGANLGLEGVAWVPDSYLVANGFRDATKGATYDPASYPGHGDGLFFVGVEATGDVHAFALGQSGTSDLVATFDSGFEIVADLEFDAERGALWVACDDTCQGRTATFTIASNGAFAPTAYYERPAGMPNLNNEGFAIAPQSQCESGSKTVLWADDGDTGGFALRSGTITCTALPATGPGTPVSVPEESLTEGTRGPVTAPSSAQQGETIRVFVGVSHAGETVDVWMYSTPTYLGKAVVSATGYVTVTIPAGLTAGAHRIAVLDASGALVGWANIQVTATGLAYTGSQAVQVAGPMSAALTLLALGGILLIVRRRNRGSHVA